MKRRYFLPALIEKNDDVAEGYSYFSKIIKYYDMDEPNDRAYLYLNAYVVWANKHYNRAIDVNEGNGLWTRGESAAFWATKLMVTHDNAHLVSAVEEFLFNVAMIVGGEVIYPLFLGELAYSKGEGPACWVDRLKKAGYTASDIRDLTLRAEF